MTPDIIHTDQYPFIINEIMKYIEKIKLKERGTPLIEIIMDYAFKNDIDANAIGDIVSSDVYFTSFIEDDCKYHNLLKNKSPVKTEEW